MQIFKKEYTIRQVIARAAAAIIIIAVIVIGIVMHSQAKRVAVIRSQQLATERISFGSGHSADAYIRLISGRSQSVSASCGSTAQNNQVLFGNFELDLVRQYSVAGLHFFKIYTFPLNDFSFSSDVPGHPVQGNLDAARLDLSGHAGDIIVVHQFETCTDHSSTLVFINQKTGELQAFESKTLSNQVGRRFITANGAKFTAVGKDKMDSFVTNPSHDLAHLLIRIHWKFDPNLNTFIETGKSAE